MDIWHIQLLVLLSPQLGPPSTSLSFLSCNAWERQCQKGIRNHRQAFTSDRVGVVGTQTLKNGHADWVQVIRRYNTVLVISAFHLMAAGEREQSAYGMGGSASPCAPPDYQNTTLPVDESLLKLSFSPCFSFQAISDNAGNRQVGPFQLQPAGWSQFLLQLPSTQIRFGDGHGNSLSAGKCFQTLASVWHPQRKKTS